jgi:hypothetical protein
MKQRHLSIGRLIILLLSLVGAAIAIYLTFVHYENAPLICSSRGIVDCAIILIIFLITLVQLQQKQAEEQMDY